MSRPLQFALALLCAGAALLFLDQAHRRSRFQPPPQLVSSPTLRESEPGPQGGRSTAVPQPLTAIPGSVAPDAVAAAPPMKKPAPAAAVPVAATQESANLAPEIILENMGRTIRQYADAFGENPVGTNPEITSALQGENPKHINFLKPDGNRVNARGELVDAWGTPYFFHQLSGHEMEIRSAGPDRVMYTQDDLVSR